MKYLFSEASQPLESSKTIQQGNSNSTMEGKKPPYLTRNGEPFAKPENQSQIRNPTYQTKDIESKNLSETSKIDFKTSSTSEHYNSLLNQEKGPNEHNFITLSNLSEDHKIEIIKTGFQLQAKEKISLKKYYESTKKYSLFQLKGYSIKYESIRRTSIYKSLKE